MMQDILDRLARLEQRMATLTPEGPVVERDHKKGVRIRTGGTDANPQLSPWVQPADRTGASRYLPQVGEQVQLISHGGDWTQARAHPMTHTDAKPNPAKDADETVHHARDGQRHAVSKGHITDQADKKHERFVGDQPKGGGGGGNFPHELQKQLAGIRADLTQNTHNISAMHDVTSKLWTLALPFVPSIAPLAMFLNGNPKGLEMSAQAMLGKLEGYVAMSFQQMVGKLTNGLLDNVMGLVQDFASGDISGLLDQVESLALDHALDIAGPLLDARNAIGQAASGTEGALSDPLGAIEGAFAGTAGEAAFGLLNGQLGGALGKAASVMAGLGDLLDGQKNITKGMTKSYVLGGY